MAMTSRVSSAKPQSPGASNAVGAYGTGSHSLEKSPTSTLVVRPTPRGEPGGLGMRPVATLTSDRAKPAVDRDGSVASLRYAPPGLSVV